MAQIEAGGLHLERQPISLSDLISDTLESFAVKAEELGIGLSRQRRPRASIRCGLTPDSSGAC